MAEIYECRSLDVQKKEDSPMLRGTSILLFFLFTEMKVQRF